MSKVKPRILIIGGGFAGLRALFHLRQFTDKAEVVLLDPRSTSLARPALPEVALANKPVDHARFPLAPVVSRSGGSFVNADVDLVEAAKSQVVLNGGDRLKYDYLLLVVGAQKDYDAIPGFRELE